MSAVAKPDKRVSIPDLMARKGREPIVALTAYSAPMARLLDPTADLLLVGDSVGMVVYGLPDTLSVTLDMMIAHGRAVATHSQHALVVVDMPFGSVEESPEQAFRNCARVLAETGAQAVKLETGDHLAETVRFLTDRGIPVLGHVGLMPQHSRAYGGFKVRGKDQASADQVMRDAQAIEAAGAFAMVIEGVVEPLARQVTEALTIPTIGIGASPACDGQILVCDDMLGLTQMALPKFVKRYADIATVISDAANSYAQDVRARHFPTEDQTYGWTNGT